MTEEPNKLLQIRDKLRQALKMIEEIQATDMVISAELSRSHADIENALRALKAHGDKGDWVG